MQLITGWKKKLKKAWSVRLALLSGFFSAASQSSSYFQDSIDPKLFALIATFLAFGTVIASIIYQESMHHDSD